MFRHLSTRNIIAFSLCLIIVVLAGWWLLMRRSPSPQLVPAAPGPPPSSGITLTIYSGQADIYAPDGSLWQPGQEGQLLKPGTKVKTGPNSRAAINYPDGTVTRLDFNTEVTIKSYQSDPQAVDINVDSGRVWSRVAALLGQKSYHTETNSVIASVRGTSYGHDHTGPHDLVIVTEHDVDVVCKNINRPPTTVHQDFQTVVDCDHYPPSISKLSNSDKQDDWYLFNNRLDQLMTLVFPSPSPTPIRVLGVTTGTGGYSKPRPTPTLIDCIGPDGKTARSIQADCDNLWQFWNTHPPAEVHRDNPSSNNSSSSTSSTPAPTPTPTPVPLTFTNVVCQTSQLAFIGCTQLLITGSGFATGINLSTIDSSQNFYPTNSISITSDTNLVASMSSDLCQADTSGFDLTLSYPAPDSRQASYYDFVPNCFQ